MLSDLHQNPDLKKPPTGTKMRERSAHSQKGINGVTYKESHLRSNKELCFGRFNSKSIFGVENSLTVTVMKQTQTRQTSSEENSSDRNGSLKRKDELMGKQEEMALLKALNWTTKGTCTMNKKKSVQTKCSDKCSTCGKLRVKAIKREAHEDSREAHEDKFDKC